MSTPQFKLGERVEARTAGFVPQGTLGTIQQVLVSILDMYYIQFDGYDDTKLLHARDVERVTDEHQPPTV